MTLKGSSTLGLSRPGNNSNLQFSRRPLFGDGVLHLCYGYCQAILSPTDRLMYLSTVIRTYNDDEKLLDSEIRLSILFSPSATKESPGSESYKKKINKKNGKFKKSSSSSRHHSTDIPDPLWSPLPIVHCFRLVFRDTSQ